VAQRISDGAVESVRMRRRTIGNQATLQLLSHQAGLPAGDPQGPEMEGLHTLSHRTNPILNLQRKIGDQGAQPLVQAKTEGVEAGSATRTTNRFAHDFWPIPVYAAGQVKPQMKLTVNTPGDLDEQEADRVADQVMRMPDQQLHGVCPCNGECPKCQAEHMDPIHLLPTRSAHTCGAKTTVAPPIVHGVLRSGGRSLDSPTRAFFEPRFGHDFCQVRVHADAKAAESAGMVNALAYTVGQDVVFGAGQFAPATNEGRRLLAHELAHVIQQSDGRNHRVSRTPKRDEIDRAYTFSTNCGWIDWTHADNSLATNLIGRVQQASDELKSAGTSATRSTGELTSPTMTSGFHGIVVHSASVRVRLLRPLSAAEVLSVSLSIFKKLSVAFEAQQEMTDLIRQSSFSQEDLPSNLIGFYMAAKGYQRGQIEQYCGALDMAASLQEFDNNHDFKKNRSFSPIGSTKPWPTELSDIDDSQAAVLYELLTISAIKGLDAYSFCPIYRIEGTIGETDLFLFGLGGASFTAADNLRVVPTYRARPGTSGSYGHVNFIEVEPYSQSDSAAFVRNKIAWPIFLPSPVLVCLSSQGNPIL
jgi:hypothetical protein